MSEFRLWLHERLARLDGVRERRIVALTAALIFAALALGPQTIQAVTLAVNTPELRLEELPSAAVSNPVRLKAISLNVQFQRVDFLLTPDSGTATVHPGIMPDASDPSRWELPEFVGEPGRSYVAKARGVHAAGAIDSSNALTFTITDPNAAPPPAGTSGTGSDPVDPPTVKMLQVNVIAGENPRLEPVASHSGFTATAGFFRANDIELTFQTESPAAQGADGLWRGAIPVPGGKRYQVRFVGSGATGSFVSQALEADVPASAATSPPPPPPPETTNETAPPPTGNTAPVLPPLVTLLAPQEGFSAPSPISLAARVTNATATALLFEILDPAGVTRTVPGARAAAGEWTAVFIGEPGGYAVGARTTLEDGTIIPPPNRRSFTILGTTAQTETATATPTTTEPPPPAPEPIIEIFSPLAGAPAFAGAVPLTSRVKNAIPDRVVAIVRNSAGAETIVLASKTATGDFWNALFEGPDGAYRFRIRATVAGRDVFSSEGAFGIKRPTATTETASPTEPLPPPPPPPTGTSTTTTSPLPPPPPPPTGTTATTASATGTVLPPPGTATPVPSALAEECRAAGILPERCAEWLKAKYQSRTCLEAGALTREACAALLEAQNAPVTETSLYGLAARADIAQAREDALRLGGTATRPADLPPSLQSLIAFRPPSDARLRFIASTGEGEDATPALVVLDTDGDGLPDDIERRLGTDPTDADSDDDGFDDGTETRNGYNPLGAGTLERPIRGVEKALLAGLALEEPRGAAGAVDPAFTIATSADAAAEVGEDEVFRLTGTAAPNTVVTIFIYSYLPVVVTTTTDENGNWTYDFGSKLSEGRHEAYVSINDDTGKLVASSSPLAFFVKEAQAVSEEDFLRPDVNVEEAPATLSRWFIWGGLGLVALALILVVAIVRQVRGAGPSDQEGPGGTV